MMAVAYSPTQTANGLFPPDEPAADIRNGAATPGAGPGIPDTTYTQTGDEAIGVAMAQRDAGLAAIQVPNMSDAGTHTAG